MAFKKLLLYYFILIYIRINGSRVIRYPIGGLFNEDAEANSEKIYDSLVKLGGSSAYHGRTIHTSSRDSYSTALELCPETSDGKGIVALIDSRPTNGICDTVCQLCNRLNISHLSLGWEPAKTQLEDVFTFSYYPPPELISKAFASLIRKLDWDKFSILYEDEGSFVRLQEIINSWPNNPSQKEPILFRKLDPDGDNKETFKYIFKIARMTYHVLDCKAKNVHHYMEEIVEVDKRTFYQSFILTDLDAYTLNLENITDMKGNVSTLHITTPGDVKWMDINAGVTEAPLETALTIDALYHLEKAIRSMQSSTEEEIEDDFRRTSVDLAQPPAICYKDTKADYETIAWPLGNSLREALIKTTSKGFTGNIEFDEFGRRTNFILHYSKLSGESKFTYDGYWDSKTDIVNTENQVEDRSTAFKPSSVIRVATRKGKPYVDIEEVNGTTTFKGYAVDLIDAIFDHINKEKKQKLEYKFQRVPFDSYGNLLPGSKKWDGLIGQLMDHEAELAICDLTITSERNAVVDFSHPFMSLGISMLFKEPEPEAPDMFSFIAPLALDVWLYLATSYIIVSFVLFICARMSQDDWVNPHACNQNPEHLQNIWTLYNCMWLTMGSIMTQGCDILPRAAGSRWITGLWWFFALIITASYTANMSTFLSNSRRSTDIEDAKALSEQNTVSYGAVYNASTYKFFATSNESAYQKIWAVMSSAKPTVFTYNNDEGKDRVLRSKGKYAFFMESTAIEYYMNRDCDLKMVGSKLDSKEYGIAFPKKSPYKSLVNTAILALQERGVLEALKTKWWSAQEGEEKCEQKDKEVDDSGSLQMKNTSGIFLVLIVGGVLGLIVAVIDFLMHSRQIAVKEKIPYKEALASEWRASLDPRVLLRAAAPPRSAPPSSGSVSPERERSQSRAVSVLRAATSFINFDEIY